jgi:hypothetical protein
MPAPQKAQFAEPAKLLLKAKVIGLPVGWSTPSGNQYRDAFALSELVTAPDPASLFLAKSPNKYHVDTQKEVGKGFADFIDKICGAICSAIDQWMKMTSVAGMIINGPVGVVAPGNVVGPPLFPFIMANGAPVNTPQLLKYSKAVGQAFGTAWQTWQSGLTGQLMYPPFAAFPGPMAPPTPNIPMPLVAFASPGEAMLSPGTLKSTMIANLGDPDALHHKELFDAISQAFAIVFPIFKATTLFQNVLGTGPIPTFAPPFVPVGPVVMGTSIPTPGVLM